ncbi:hypothetical protein ASE61_00725 [Bosea sp. Root670]|uniref:phage recombination protein Bet n=1 Tax=Bosea sp. Root670 TaxID=1736583 RepID=UPI000712F505|nr:phage recombination protein Bet [Bosea sp. Root670]KRE08175.1 hypothetical protein ASE61_00725 [Bosea sp. Root670]
MNALVELQPPRLPYHPAVEDRFQIDKSGWKALVEAVYPLAKTPDSVVMALSYCKARKLDPFKKPVHIVPMWDSKKKAYVETIWPGISEVRTTAFRTGQYAGCDEAEFGPTIERTFTGKVKKGDGWVDQTVTVEFPEWCRMTVYRVLGDRVCKFVGPKVKWLESCATIGNTDLPNDMWQSRPEGQIEKCAEAAALRKAFPEELGNQLTAEEMEGRRVEGDVAVAEVAEVSQRRLPPAPPVTRQIAHVETGAPETGEVQQDEPSRDEPQQEVKPARRAAPKPAETKPENTKVTSGRQPAQQQDQGEQQQDDAYEGQALLTELQETFDQIDSVDALDAYTGGKGRGLTIYNSLTRSDQEDAQRRYELAKARIKAADEAEEVAANEAAAAEMGDPVGPDERGHPDDDFPGDKPPKAAAQTEKKPEKIDAAELEAHIRGYIETMTDAEALKKRWYGDDENREILDDKTRQALRTLWKARMDDLRAAEGQG